MNKIKTLDYDWELGHEELIVKVDAYYNDNLYIGLYHMDGGGLESFADLTVNLPGYSNEVNEAFITDFCSKDHLKFIQKHKLGKVLPETGHSGYCTYAKVAFNLDRLAELDKKGVEEYRKNHGIKPEKSRQGKKKSERER